MKPSAPRPFFQPSQLGALRGLPGIRGPACSVFEPPSRSSVPSGGNQYKLLCLKLASNTAHSPKAKGLIRLRCILLKSGVGARPRNQN